MDKRLLFLHFFSILAKHCFWNGFCYTFVQNIGVLLSTEFHVTVKFIFQWSHGLFTKCRFSLIQCMLDMFYFSFADLTENFSKFYNVVNFYFLCRFCFQNMAMGARTFSLELFYFVPFGFTVSWNEV